jgi:IS1 transposase
MGARVIPREVAPLLWVLVEQGAKQLGHLLAPFMGSEEYYCLSSLGMDGAQVIALGGVSWGWNHHLLAFGLVHFYTDAAGVYERPRPVAAHTVGKINTHQIERKQLTLRTRIKRLARKPLCFSKAVFLHDTVIGLLVNRYEFGTPS